MPSKPNKPPSTNLAQQRLQGFSLSPSPMLLAIIYLFLSGGFAGMSILYMLESDKITDVIKRYDDIPECKADLKTPRPVLEILLLFCTDYR